MELLDRAGYLKETEEFVRKMQVEPDNVLWRNLTWASKVHGDVSRGKHLVKHLELLNKNASDCGSYGWEVAMIIKAKVKD